MHEFFLLACEDTEVFGVVKESTSGHLEPLTESPSGWSTLRQALAWSHMMCVQLTLWLRKTYIRWYAFSWRVGPRVTYQMVSDA